MIIKEVEIIYFTLLLRSQAIPGHHSESNLISFAAVLYQEGFHSTTSSRLPNSGIKAKVLGGQSLVIEEPFSGVVESLLTENAVSLAL